VGVDGALTSLHLVWSFDPTGRRRGSRSRGRAQPIPATPAFPALTKPGEIHLSVEGPSETNGNLTSRYVLYRDSTFALQYVGLGVSFDYPGRYLPFGSTIMLDSSSSTRSATAVRRAR
jgi:hypothetical protein